MVITKLETEHIDSDLSDSISSFSETKYEFSTEESAEDRSRYVASIRLNGRLIGPYDVQILSSRYYSF